MSLASEPVDPPCPNRPVGTIKGIIKHAKCNDQSNPHYRQLIEPAHCQRCLLGPEVGPAEKKADTPDMPKPAVQPDQSAAGSAETPPKTPGLLRRARSYAQALAAWTAAGKPERSDKEVERIFRQF